jgi:hypothetical protein
MNIDFCAPARSERCADEGELLLGLTKHGPTLPNDGPARQRSSALMPWGLGGRRAKLVKSKVDGHLMTSIHYCEDSDAFARDASQSSCASLVAADSQSVESCANSCSLSRISRFS